ncbi:hypothetical protein C8R46DRAFT_1345836 [Mycena filopes]|nr:hypothetical protein C8R46DRAFT_1345836 [Mycena filopes]
MSLSMDDLCASLSSSHVGQEAMDLAALQVQLAQTLFCHSMASSAAAQQQQQQQRQDDYPPALQHTHGSLLHGRSNAPTPPPRDHFRDEMEEDERMVEDLLIPTSPASPKQQQQQNPFYIAQLQATQSYGVSPPSVFSQSAFPSQQSPFMIHSNFQRHNATQNPLSLDTHHSLMVSATSSFDR